MATQPGAGNTGTAKTPRKPRTPKAEKQAIRTDDAIVDEAGEESMIASDPPAFTASVASAPVERESTEAIARMDEATKQRILERAYEIWERTGRQHGQDLEHWLLAELEVTGNR